MSTWSMEKVLKVLGMVIFNKTYLPYNSFIMGKNVVNRTPAVSRRNGTVYNNKRWYFIIYTFIQGIFKKDEMGELTYPLAVKLGLILWVVGIIENFNNWIGGAMSVLGCIGMCAYIFYTYQKGRKLRIDNDHAEFELWMKKHGRNNP